MYIYIYVYMCVHGSTHYLDIKGKGEQRHGHACFLIHLLFEHRFPPHAGGKVPCFSSLRDHAGPFQTCIDAVSEEHLLRNKTGICFQGQFF